jgi:hypothetical protein
MPKLLLLLHDNVVHHLGIIIAVGIGYIIIVRMSITHVNHIILIEYIIIEIQMLISQLI